jgi:DNA-binding NarL/FixJ family response regulator
LRAREASRLPRDPPRDCAQRDRRRRESVRTASERWHLTPRQSQVLDLITRGFTNALIADELRIRERTVEFHASAIFDKAGVESRTMLIARLHRL